MNELIANIINTGRPWLAEALLKNSRVFWIWPSFSLPSWVLAVILSLFNHLVVKSESINIRLIFIMEERDNGLGMLTLSGVVDDCGLSSFG
jgi:hypothetical protein